MCVRVCVFPETPRRRYNLACVMREVICLYCFYCSLKLSRGILFLSFDNHQFFMSVGGDATDPMARYIQSFKP